MALTNKNRHFSTYEDALDDLLFRFVNFIEEDEVNDLVRVMFHIEQAWWTYVDHTLPSNPHLKSKPFHTFTVDIINHSPFLQHFKDQSHNALEVFREYKKNIPTCGTIIVDSSLEYCLVLSMYSSSKNFGFPKGKINQNEELVDCAIRETYEETGFDCSSHIHKNIFFDAKINQSSCRLYLVTGIPLDFKFKPKARHEIKKIQWLLINALPNSKDDFENAALCDGKPGNFFLILPFVKQLKNVIRKLRNPHADVNTFSNNCNSSMTMKRNVEIRPSRSSAFKPVKRDISQENIEYKKVYSKSECGTPRKTNNISSYSTGKSNDKDKGEPNFHQNQLLNNLLTEDEKTGADFFRNYGYDNTTVTPAIKSINKKKIDGKKKKNDSSQVCNNTVIKENKKEVNNHSTNVQNNVSKKNLDKSIKPPKKAKSLSGRKTEDLSPSKSQISSNLLREFQETNEGSGKRGITNTTSKKKNNEKKLSSNKDVLPSSKEQLTTRITPQYSGIDFIKIFYNTQGSK
ncbi:m7GpppN-mRNA hydrolase [Strongyloides ratti]|uniref:mRNA-decapping enzyme 2 n=1 Tax=Strongyloides ratti TaxID=34506 RepID=A0A090LNP8_STRRB|nr:m7GpppN-mRNA hydrolase [Strongyloides ratti]CEF69794.1 m7GpppN-mRNA hydrolase [Strongyloides ratti]